VILSRHPQSQVLVALVDRRQAVVAAALSVTFSHILHLTKTCRHDDDDDDDDDMLLLLVVVLLLGARVRFGLSHICIASVPFFVLYSICFAAVGCKF